MIGEKLRHIRQSKNLSIAEIAEQSGLSQSFISQIERDLNSPSIASLRVICDVLKVPIFQLFIDEENDCMVVRKNERKKISYPGTDVTYELLVPDLNRSLEAIIITLSKEKESFQRPIGHEGEEIVLVLKGSIEATLGTKTYVLKNGDTICYDSNIPHFFLNNGEKQAQILVISTPPFI